LTFVQFSGAGTYTAGAGLTLTGTVFSIGSAQVTNAMLVNSSVTVNAGTGITTTSASIALGASASLAVDQTFSPTWSGTHTFSSFQAWQTIATPTTPSSGTIKVYAKNRNNFDRPAYVGSDGVETVLSRDSMWVVRNNTGSTITRGSAVYVNGSTGSIATVALAQADATMSKLPAIGLAATDIPNNSFGRVILTGDLASFNTSGFSAGDTLYVSATTPGALTNVAPTHPSVEQSVGVVTASGVGNGEVEVFVTPINLHKIDGVNGSSFAIGDGTGTTKSLLIKNTAGTGTLSWNPTTARTLTLPDATDTLVGKATADIFTNKSISGSTNTLTNIANGSLVNSSVTVTAGTGLSGGGSVALGASVTLSLPNTGPGAGAIGGGTSFINSITLDAQGRVTAATTGAPAPLGARTVDQQLTTTSATTVATYTPGSTKGLWVALYYRVAVASTNVTITVSWTDATGAQSYTALPTTSQATGSYVLVPIFIVSTNAAVTVQFTAGTANQVFASAAITEA
jgi:hypothetical protein